jgi:single-stranded DNA-binding protein
MSLNYISLSGQLLQDSEIRFTVSGKAVMEFNLVLSDNHHPDQTHTIRVINRRDSSPELQRQLRKGTNVIVEGQLQQRKHIVSGHKQMLPEIQLESLSILGSTL